MTTGRRFLGGLPKFAGKAWEDVSHQLDDLLRKLWDSESNGVPSGFKDLVPSTVEASSGSGLGDPGDLITGWAASNHDHIASTATPVSLNPSSVNTEGTSNALARADHQHDVSAIVDESMIFAIIFGGK